MVRPRTKLEVLLWIWVAVFLLGLMNRSELFRTNTSPKENWRNNGYLMTTLENISGITMILGVLGFLATTGVLLALRFGWEPKWMQRRLAGVTIINRGYDEQGAYVDIATVKGEEKRYWCDPDEYEALRDLDHAHLMVLDRYVAEVYPAGTAGSGRATAVVDQHTKLDAIFRRSLFMKPDYESGVVTFIFLGLGWLAATYCFHEGLFLMIFGEKVTLEDVYSAGSRVQLEGIAWTVGGLLLAVPIIWYLLRGGAAIRLEDDGDDYEGISSGRISPF